MNNSQLDWSQFILLAVDLQRDFWPDTLEKAYPNFANNITQLFELCRAEGIEIVHLRASFQPDKSDWMPIYKLKGKIPCVKGTSGEDTLPFAHENLGERVFIKKTYDGFNNTNLLTYLNKRNKRFILCAGLVTSICVFLTAASAMQNNFLTAIIDDCSADIPERHIQTLTMYDFLFKRTKVNLIIEEYSGWSESIKSLYK